MTAPAPPPAAAPVTRAEFDRLIAIVRDMVNVLKSHRHGWSRTDTMTFGPDDGAHKEFAEILTSLDELEAEHGEG